MKIIFENLEEVVVLVFVNLAVNSQFSIQLGILRKNVHDVY